MSAIFLVVVVALTAGYVVAIGNAQRTGSVLALLGARAGFAAQSGVEWAVATVVATHACPTP
ncbi:MAG: agglutinin biogenesis protein MshP, partial [Gammaproteobacteria bacterium]|nr:agglutinin biogenesis protein MshP [Gammaproteobacteria bacterium]